MLVKVSSGRYEDKEKKVAITRVTRQAWGSKKGGIKTSSSSSKMETFWRVTKLGSGEFLSDKLRTLSEAKNFVSMLG